MKIYDCVKTEQKAEELIRNEVNSIGLNSEIDPDTDGFFEDTIVRCECGETKALQWVSMGGSIANIRVAICECCGDDNSNAIVEII